MADVVLVHGAWHGAWCWRKLLPSLWAAGHRAFAMDLTGLGARRHLFRADIGLADHIQDVVATLEAEELRDAVLVGHSYAGMVITGVAERCGERLSTLVYLDAVVPEPGESWSSTHTATTQAERRAQIAEHGGLTPPDPSAFGLQGADRDWSCAAKACIPAPATTSHCTSTLRASPAFAAFSSTASRPLCRPLPPAGSGPGLDPAGRLPPCQRATTR